MKPKAAKPRTVPVRAYAVVCQDGRAYDVWVTRGAAAEMVNHIARHGTTCRLGCPGPHQVVPLRGTARVRGGKRG